MWLVTSRPLAMTLRLFPGESRERVHVLEPDTAACRVIQVGRNAFFHLIDVTLDTALPLDCLIGYDLQIPSASGADRSMAEWAPYLLYPGQTHPCFVIKSRIDRLLHGSCRKPHSRARDGLVRADQWLAEQGNAEARPAVLLMTGDQIYADDVAGPMLVAIHALIKRLGLYQERFDGAVVEDSEALAQDPASYYRREKLLPAFKSNEALRERFFGGVEKPIFTTNNAHNHLVSLSEVLAMYLLVWSPVPWTLIEPVPPELDESLRERYCEEAGVLKDFVQGLPSVARILANVPTLMIFDDHDVTDDWNLSALWEKTVYEHPFARRIVGNTLISYTLCQGWGNQPEAFQEVLESLADLFETACSDGVLDSGPQDELIGRLQHFQHWHYELPTSPPLIVLDTRTRRWRSERHPSRPSGLMDWEALTEFQQALLGHRAAIVVSAPPMFGVKLIEAVQRIFTWCGQPLMVDAENWMAHPGSAHVLLRIFRHSRTPGNYVILSGDVHYSFVYDVRIRDQETGPRIWQITSSGVKNEFPPRLLEWFDRLNRWLYAPWSPLNWFTKRRRMEVSPYLPDRREAGERLWNGAGMGLVELDESGCPITILQLNADGSPATRFVADQKVFNAD
ncbi:hypothetical protein IQ22_04192 [Pseudomonas duriflava]|uniref:PhoD-like phosphatase n=2 Tax=Pseudomonas duriflava TaxID=459528 RepID=A0A562PUC0_9PSED|nr:hypothetical protein IQ22_04192 [Pseudomonas duriflava]